ncbi:MAG: hypothetical protein H6706_13400 [Myxococcales bacterium]|nr:hypothetical protein [Myxococcales bacterium]
MRRGAALIFCWLSWGCTPEIHFDNPCDPANGAICVDGGADAGPDATPSPDAAKPRPDRGPRPWLEVLLYTFFQVGTWSQELQARQHLLLEIKRGRRGLRRRARAVQRSG